MDLCKREKLEGALVLEGPTLLRALSIRNLPGSHCENLGKSPYLLWQWGVEDPCERHPETPRDTQGPDCNWEGLDSRRMGYHSLVPESEKKGIPLTQPPCSFPVSQKSGQRN